MDNQNPQPTNPPAENPVQSTVSTQSTVTPPPSKSFLSTKIILLIVIFLILIAGGGTYLALNSKPKTEPVVSKSTPTSASTPTPDPIASWKTYTNALYGISFQYPKDGIVAVVPKGKDWEGDINADKLQLDTKVNIQNSRETLIGNPANYANLVNWYNFIFKVYDNPQNLSLDYITASKLLRTQPVMIGNITGIEGSWVSSDVGSLRVAVFNHENKIYVFEMTNDNGEVNEVGEKILNDMLSTLKFTERP